MRLAFPTEARLRQKSQFDAVYARGHRLGDGYFTVVTRANDVAGPRLGLAIAVKVAGNSVRRNRIRRLIRESFRLHRHELPHVDLIVSARTPARTAAAPALRASLEALWIRVSEQCASLPQA